MQKLKYFLSSILFLAFIFIALFVFSTKSFKTQIFAENSLKVNDQVEVQIKFTSPSNIVTADFKVVVTNGQLVSLKCAEASTFSKIYGDATNCSLGHFGGGSLSDVLAVATVKATAVGDMKVVGEGVLYNVDGNEIAGAKYTEAIYSVVADNTNPPSDPASCFGQAFLYQKSPYEYKVNQSMSASGSNDWVKFPLNSNCRSKQVLESIFGPLDDVNNDGTVFITRPNQPGMYGFTFNRIVAIDGYDTADILTGQAGKSGLTEQQLHDLHYAGKDTQSIENCDYNAAQMVFDMVKNEAKPNMADYKPSATGYYQFDITPKFACSGNNPNQQSLGAGFVRVTGDAPSVHIVCKSLQGIAKDLQGTSVLLSELPKDFLGKVTLTCEGKSKGKDINYMAFTFSKDGNLISNSGDGTVSNNVVAIDCTNEEKANGYKCAVGSVDFDISGTGNYSASSKVCIVEGSTKTCSPNGTN